MIGYFLGTNWPDRLMENLWTLAWFLIHYQRTTIVYAEASIQSQ